MVVTLQTAVMITSFVWIFFFFILAVYWHKKNVRESKLQVFKASSPLNPASQNKWEHNKWGQIKIFFRNILLIETDTPIQVVLERASLRERDCKDFSVMWEPICFIETKPRSQDLAPRADRIWGVPYTNPRPFYSCQTL